MLKASHRYNSFAPPGQVGEETLVSEALPRSLIHLTCCPNPACREKVSGMPFPKRFILPKSFPFIKVPFLPPSHSETEQAERESLCYYESEVGDNSSWHYVLTDRAKHEVREASEIQQTGAAVFQQLALGFQSQLRPSLIFTGGLKLSRHKHWLQRYSYSWYLGMLLALLTLTFTHQWKAMKIQRLCWGSCTEAGEGRNPAQQLKRIRHY